MEVFFEYLVESLFKHNGISLIGIFKTLSILVIMMLLVYLLTVVLHEVGHMIGGYIIGYRLTSLRIFNIAILKDSNRFRIKKVKRESFAGIGQCLMYPNEIIKSSIPLCIGGIIANLIQSVISHVLFVQTNKPLLWYFLFLNFIFGLVLFIQCAIPQAKYIETDAWTIRSLKNNSVAEKCYQYEQVIVKRLIDGKSYAEMEEFLFELTNENNILNDLILDNYMYQYYRALEMEDIKKATRIISLLKSLYDCLNEYFREQICIEELYLAIIKKDYSKVEIFENKYKDYIEDENSPQKVRIKAALSKVKNDHSNYLNCVAQLKLLSEHAVFTGDVKSNYNILKRWGKAYECVC